MKDLKQTNHDLDVASIEYVASVVATGVDGFFGDVVVAMSVFVPPKEGKIFTSTKNNTLISINQNEERLFDIKLDYKDMTLSVQPENNPNLDGLVRVVRDYSDLSYATGFIPHSDADLYSKLTSVKQFCTQMIEDSFGSNGIIHFLGFGNKFTSNDLTYDFRSDYRNHPKTGFPRLARKFNSDQFKLDYLTPVIVTIITEGLSTYLRNIYLDSYAEMYPELNIPSHYGLAANATNSTFTPSIWNTYDDNVRGFWGESYRRWVASNFAYSENMVSSMPKADSNSNTAPLESSAIDYSAMNHEQKTFPFNKDVAKKLLNDVLPEINAKKTTNNFYLKAIPGFKRQCIDEGRRLTPKQMYWLGIAHRELVLGENLDAIKFKKK